jgi:hypothetical protein
MRSVVNIVSFVRAEFGGSDTVRQKENDALRRVNTIHLFRI